jgi:hypothetical protein
MIKYRLAGTPALRKKEKSRESFWASVTETAKYFFPGSINTGSNGRNSSGH